MMLFSIYDSLFWKGDKRHILIQSTREAVELQVEQMYKLLENLKAYFQESSFTEDFIEDTFSKKGIFRKLFDEMGFRARNADNIFKLLMRHHRKLQNDSQQFFLTLDDITIEEDFWKEDSAAPDLMISVDGEFSEIEMAAPKPLPQPPENRGEMEEVEAEKPNPGIFAPLPSQSDSDQEEESTSYDEEEESSLEM
jgi:hypothetical protein